MRKYPKLFISYSQDNEGHRAWVKKLATDSRQHMVLEFVRQCLTNSGKEIYARDYKK